MASNKNFSMPQRKLPEPSPQSGGSWRLWILAILAVLMVSSSAFWLSRQPEEREKWQAKAANILDNATRGTPAHGLGDLLRNDSPPLPDSVVRPLTMPGTLAGQSIQAGVAGGVGTGSNEHGSGEASLSGQLPPVMASESDRGGAEPGQPELPVREDSRISAALVNEVARYIVAHYKTGQHGGSLALSAQALNHRYGLRLGQSQQGGRQGLLRYAFHPSMIRGLYELYIERFMQDLTHACETRRLTPAQSAGMFRLLGSRTHDLALGLSSVAAVKDLQERLAQEASLVQFTAQINSQMAAAILENDELREKNASASQLSAGRLRLDGLAARYRRALEDQARSSRELLALIRRSGVQPVGRHLDDDSLIFLARWVCRRTAGDKDAVAAVEAAVEVLTDLSRRCYEAARLELQKAPEIQKTVIQP